MSGEILGDLRASDETRRKGLLLIHGAGDWQENYWENIAHDVDKFIGGTGKSFAAAGVYYADFNSTMKTLTPSATTAVPAMNQFRNDFLNELLRDRLTAKVATMSHADVWNKLVLAALPGGATTIGILTAANQIAKLFNAPDAFLDTVTRAVLGISLSDARQQIENTVKPAQANISSTVQEVAWYLYDNTFAQQIRQKMIAGLKEMQKYDEVVIVSHSLGTVITFDVLNEWTEGTPKISHWFTLGCPLTKVLRLRPGTSNRLKYPNVTYWYNVYDSTDLIAGQLGPSFIKEGYGVHDIFVDIADDPIKSHDYFTNATTLNLIADAMR